MSFRDKLSKKEFVITGEIGPPKGTNIDRVLPKVNLMKDKVDAINVTDLQRAIMRVGSLAMSKILVDNGVEPIFQVTTRDRNRLALQSDILSAHVLGIRNVLILTGDHPILGDHPQAMPVYDLDSINLLKAVSNMNNGMDMLGNKLNAPTDMFCGAVVNPGADPLEPEIFKMEKKIKVGAKFFQTQAVFDPEVFRKFMIDIKHLDVPVLAGIVLLKSAAMARYMNEHVPGVLVPELLINRMETTKDKKQEAIEIAVEIINNIKDICAGVHIMPIGLEDIMPEIIDRVK